jgi:hypothetical protein
MHIDLHVKYPSYLSDFRERWTVSTDFRKIHKHKISWKFVQCKPSCSMRTDGRTDRQTDITSLIVAFRNFANAPKIETHSRHSAVGVMTRLWAGYFGLQFPAQARDFSPLHNLQTVSASPPFILLFKWHRGVLPGVKRQRRKVNHSLPLSAELKNEWSLTSSPSISSHRVDTDNFTFTTNLQNILPYDKCISQINNY